MDFKKKIDDMDNSDDESNDYNVMTIDDDSDYKKHAKGDDHYDTYEILSDWLSPQYLLEMRKDKFKINDRILVNPDDQTGMKLYRVRKDKNKGKDVKLIRDYDMEYSDVEDEEDNEDDKPKSKKQKKEGGKKNKSKKQQKSKKGGKTRKSKKEIKTRKNRK
jgi:hypothetical protein